MSERWILIRPSEDGNPITYLSESGLAALLADSVGEYGVREFLPAVPDERDPNYWREGTALLLRAEVVVPSPVTTAWELP